MGCLAILSYKKNSLEKVTNLITSVEYSFYLGFSKKYQYIILLFFFLNDNISSKNKCKRIWIKISASLKTNWKITYQFEIHIKRSYCLKILVILFLIHIYLINITWKIKYDALWSCRLRHKCILRKRRYDCFFNYKWEIKKDYVL